MKSLGIAATGMLAQQLNVEVISNNIANLNTSGFKRQRAEFQDLLYQNLRRIGATSSDTGTIVPSGIQIGVGVKTASVYRITEQGNLLSTENSLDLALDGKGYFQITLPSGQIAYSRAGTFQLSPTGDLVTADGFLLEPTINIPQDATDISINATGEVLIQQDGNTSTVNQGQIQLATFPNAAGLEAIGDNLFLQTAASGAPVTGTAGSAGFGSLLQGFLEASNVNPVQEVTTLITAQRAYEMNSKVITTSDEMMRSITSLR